MTFAACAALLSGAAQAASVTVILNGKTPVQVSTEIAHAAHTVCLIETAHEEMRHIAMDACERQTKATAMAEAEVKMTRMAKRAEPTTTLAGR